MSGPQEVLPELEVKLLFPGRQKSRFRRVQGEEGVPYVNPFEVVDAGRSMLYMSKRRLRGPGYGEGGNPNHADQESRRSSHPHTWPHKKVLSRSQ